jgi:hypothetical protein
MMKAESGPAKEGNRHHTVHWQHIACEDAPAQRGLLHSRELAVGHIVLT